MQTWDQHKNYVEEDNDDYDYGEEEHDEEDAKDDENEEDENEEDDDENEEEEQTCDHRNHRIYKFVDRVCRVSCFSWLAGGNGPCGKVYRWFVWYACDCGFIWESGVSDDCGGHGAGPLKYGFVEEDECYTKEELDENGRPRELRWRDPVPPRARPTSTGYVA